MLDATYGNNCDRSKPITTKNLFVKEFKQLILLQMKSDSQTCLNANFFISCNCIRLFTILYHIIILKTCFSPELFWLLPSKNDYIGLYIWNWHCMYFICTCKENYVNFMSSNHVYTINSYYYNYPEIYQPNQTWLIIQFF